MTYEAFMIRVCEFLNAAGGGYSTRFTIDREHGKYIADCSSKETGEVIRCTGNSVALKLTVRFGAALQHQAMI